MSDYEEASSDSEEPLVDPERASSDAEELPGYREEPSSDCEEPLGNTEETMSDIEATMIDVEATPSDGLPIVNPRVRGDQSSIVNQKMALSALAHPHKDYSYAFLDEFAKREIRRRILKAIAIPGYQVPYASRELPIARGWGTGGLQITLSLVGPSDIVKVIDQGDDESVNAANLRRFVARMAGVQTTTDPLRATLIQSRHRIPEERLREGQTLILQVPVPEPLRYIEPSMARTLEMHADADYALMWLTLYEQLVRYGAFMTGASYPVVVHGRYLMSPSPIPRWDTPMLHQAAHLTILSAGREKRLYAVPPYTDVYPLEFDDVHFQVESQARNTCYLTSASHKFMNEIPQADGSSLFTLSDTGYAAKLLKRLKAEDVSIGETYYDENGNFYHAGYLES